MKPGDPVTVDGKLAHVEAVEVRVRFEDGERQTVLAEACSAWPPAASEAGTET